MTNYEVVTSMPIDDFNEIIAGLGNCWICAFAQGSQECQTMACETGMILWLQQEDGGGAK